MELFDVTTVKGFRDYLPPESLIRERITKIAKEVYKKYGFLPVETPVIEFDELMRPDTPNDEDEAVADRFRLKDRGGRNLGLRYEFTFQLARIFKENPNIKLPFRRYQIGTVFRDEPIRLGRTRQFTQCDADIVGDESILADADCLAMVSEIFSELGIKDIEVKVNNRKLLNAIVESVEIDAKQQVLRELDKLEKLGPDEVKLNLKKYASTNQILTLFKLLEKNLEFMRQNAFEGAVELEELIQLAGSMGVKVTFSPTLVRGFSYYTGNIFEVVKGGKSALAGGGRYDKSIGKYSNRQISAVGISFSLAALMGICAEELAKLPKEQTTKTVLISIGQDETALKLANKLRSSNISLIMFQGKPGKALEYADAYSIPYAIFLGEEEIEKKKLKLRDLSSGAESMLTEAQVLKKLGKQVTP